LEKAQPPEQQQEKSEGGRLYIYPSGSERKTLALPDKLVRIPRRFTRKASHAFTGFCSKFLFCSFCAFCGHPFCEIQDV
jgi:hypothetical protein